MNLYILDNKKLEKYTLPKNIDEDYAIDYKPYNSTSNFLISLEAKDNLWNLKSTGSVNVISGEMIADRVVLQDYNFYQLKMLGIDYYIYIYTTPSENDCIYKLGLEKTNKIKIGNSQDSQIAYNISSPTPFEVFLTKEENGWTIEQNNVPFSIYVNKTLLIEKQKRLRFGDSLFLGGLRVILMKDFIEINNPNNMVGVNGLFAYTVLDDNTQYSEVTEEEKNVDLYKDEDYFFHAPNIKEKLQVKEVRIDTPPGNQNPENSTILMTIGTTITMLSSIFMMSYNIINQIQSGRTTKAQLIPQFVMLGAMLIGALFIPTLIRAIEKSKKKKKEKQRLKLYGEYLDGKEKEISALILNQANIMNNNMPTAEKCKEIITNKTKNFWGRELQDDDFLTIRLGIGTTSPKVKINAPEQQFSLEVDELLQNVYNLREKYQKVNDVPIDVNLIEKNISSIICDDNKRQNYIDNILMQILTLHSPLDLKIFLITNKDNIDNWNYIKMSPHVWNETKDTRYYATNLDEAKEISEKLDEIFKFRKEGDKKQADEDLGIKENKSGDAKKYKTFENYYLIIVDDLKIAKSLPIINDIQNSAENQGFSILYSTNNIKLLPVACTSFIEIGKDDGAFLEKDISADKQKMFKLESFNNNDIKEYVRMMANIPTITKTGSKELPSSLNFLEMYGVSKIEQLNISNRWKNDSPVNTLATPIGVQEDGELFKLNLHEKNHGPHGLIAGSTGSGKSEFIITYILSMAVNYHPYEVQFVLIDYKGGGLAGAFENKETGVTLPHLTGTITNLDISEMNRTLVSIESEVKRRQKVFNEVKDKLDQSTIDIYKYQKYYRDGLIDEPMSHLFIISDEFAELKSQQPEFMDELISIARIGRSLGVHLILATQKPSGVVNEQIWSNSKFKVCLKVQSSSDSMEMLKRPEAASIKEAGRFYLQVGYNDLFQLGQSAWSGAKYVPSDKIIKKIDDSINFVSNTGEIIKSVEDAVVVDTTQDYGEQLTNLVKYMYDLGKKESIVTNKLWLDAIPEKIFLQNIKTKYSFTPSPYKINPVIGEYDDPANQKQNILTLDISAGNSLIYGQTGSGKENLLSTILYSTVTEHRPEEVNFYIIDCGAETLKTYSKLPHVGEVATVGEPDKIAGMFEMVSEEIENRRNLFADYGGNYTEYCNNSGNKLPLIVTIINYYDTFAENYSKMEDNLMSLYRDGSKYGIMFIITANSSSSVRMKMVQYFPNQITLKLSDNTKYRDAIGARKGLIPANYFGRGLSKVGEGVYEFQTALFVERNMITPTIRQLVEQQTQMYDYKAKPIPVMPDEIKVELFDDTDITLDKVPIGYSVRTKMPYYYNFALHKVTPIISDTIDDDRICSYFAMIKLISRIPNIKLKVIDFVQMYNREVTNFTLINDNFDTEIVEMNNEIIQNKESNTKLVYIILGIGNIYNKLSEATKPVFDNIMSHINDNLNGNIILMDGFDSYREIQVEEWYSEVINKKYGIWLGPNIANQTAFKVSNITMDDRRTEYPFMEFAIVKGQKEDLVHVIDRGEEDDEDEEDGEISPEESEKEVSEQNKEELESIIPEEKEAQETQTDISIDSLIPTENNEIEEDKEQLAEQTSTSELDEISDLIPEIEENKVEETEGDINEEQSISTN